MDAPDNLALWSLHCYCIGARRTPHATARAYGRELASGNPVEDAEAIRDLVATHLINPATRLPAFPILGPDRIEPVRRCGAGLALAIVDDCAAQISSLLNMLDTRGLPDSASALLLGHVFDTLLWDRLKVPLALPDTSLTPDRPDWRGVFWAVWPPVPGAVGTNEEKTAGWRLSLVWCAEDTDRLRALARAPWLPRALAALDTGAPPREAVGAGLFATDGKPAFAVLRDGDALSIRLEYLADRAAALILDRRDRLDIPGLDPAEARIVALHEVIWALPGALGAAGLWRGGGYPGNLAAALVARRSSD